MRFAFSLAVLAVCAFPVHAQDENSVVVTATRFPERLRYAPIGVRVITSADIAASAAGSLPELLSKLGGLHVRDNAGSPDKQLDLRGFGITADQNTLVLVDGVRINQNDIAATRLSTIPLQAIERIEILPGGGAVPYGGGATGGTIHIITRTARADGPRAAASLEAGSYGLADARLSSTVTGERFGLSVHANHVESDGYRANNRLRQDNVLGDLRLGDAAAHVGLKLGSDWQRLRLPGVRNEQQFVSDPRGATTPNDYSYRDGDSAALYGRYVSGRAEFAANLSYRGQVAAIFNDSGFPLFGETKLSDVAFSPRLRLSLESFGVPSALVAGIDMTDGDLKRRIAGSPAGLSNPLAVNTSAQTGRGLYLQYQLRFQQGTSVDLGWRTQRVNDRLQTSSIFAPPADLSQSRRANAGDVAIRHNFAGGLSLFARAGTSFRFATVDDNGQTSTGLLLEPQTARHRDLGAEYSPAANLRLRANYYRIELENEIYFSPLALTPAFFPGANVNLSPTQRSGWEFSAAWSPAPALDLAGSLNLQTAKFRSGVYGGVDVSGRDVPLVPRSLATLRAAWRPAGAAQLNASLRFVGEQRYDNDQDNLFPRLMPKYSVVDVNASHALGAWRLAAGVRNLFDKKYFSYGIINNFTCTTPACVYPEAGRTVFVSAEFRQR
jgi:iron complex outermembrane receptor protein